MRVSQEQIEFVSKCIARGDDAGPDAVFVDVALIGAEYKVTWPVAMKIMRRAAKALGHTIVARNKVSRRPEMTPTVAKPIVTRMTRMLDATATLMRDYENNPRKPVK